MSELVQLKLNIGASVGDSTPTEDLKQFLPLIEVVRIVLKNNITKMNESVKIHFRFFCVQKIKNKIEFSLKEKYW